MTPTPFEQYLGRLRGELDRCGLLDARIIDEAREHLRDARQDGLERGLPVDAAEREALVRFGSPERLVAEFQQVYRRGYLLWYLVKIAGSVVAAAAVALIIQVVVNLRFELQAEAVRLTPGFGKAAVLSVAVVIGLAAAWEIGRRPFDARRASIALGSYVVVCVGTQWLFAEGLAFGPAAMLVALGCLCSRLERRPAKLVVTFAIFAVTIVAVHRLWHIGVDTASAAAASAVLIAVWTSTITIFSQGDRVFSRRFSPQD